MQAHQTRRNALELKRNQAEHERSTRGAVAESYISHVGCYRQCSGSAPSLANPLLSNAKTLLGYVSLVDPNQNKIHASIIDRPALDMY